MTTALQTTQAKDPREADLIEFLSQDIGMTEAGRRAGYSESYCLSRLHLKWNDPQFVTRYVQHHKAKSAALLSKSHKLDKIKFNQADTLAQEITNALVGVTDPEKRIAIVQKGLASLSKLDRTQERLAKQSGLLKDQQAPEQPTISIGQVQNLLLGVSSDGIGGNVWGNSNQTEQDVIDITPNSEAI